LSVKWNSVHHDGAEHGQRMERRLFADGDAAQVAVGAVGAGRVHDGAGLRWSCLGDDVRPRRLVLGLAAG
jgi:hypothetical protein